MEPRRERMMGMKNYELRFKLTYGYPYGANSFLKTFGTSRIKRLRHSKNLVPKTVKRVSEKQIPGFLACQCLPHDFFLKAYSSSNHFFYLPLNVI